MLSAATHLDVDPFLSMPFVDMHKAIEAERAPDINELSRGWSFYSYCNELTLNGFAPEQLISFHCSPGLCLLLITNVSHLRMILAQGLFHCKFWLQTQAAVSCHSIIAQRFAPNVY